MKSRNRTSDEPVCTNCTSTNTYFSKKRNIFICEDCGAEFQPEADPFEPQKVFLSYGHDDNTPLVEMIKEDLEKRGHEVWFDRKDIKPGDDWRQKITAGIKSSNQVLSFLSQHSTRDPGVCLDEISIAIAVKNGNIKTVLLENEEQVSPPPSLSHIQWLDMKEWQIKFTQGGEEWLQWYQAKLDEILKIIESKESIQFSGEIERLKKQLRPISSEQRISSLLKREMTGRDWLTQKVESWCDNEADNSRLFWLTGAPGVGKSKFAAHLAHFGKHRIIAAEFCEWHKSDHRDAHKVIRSLAFQLATRLAAYRTILFSLPELDSLDTKSATDLFSYLITDPLNSANIDGGHSRYLILIDALDEAADGNRNPLVELLAREARNLPHWLGLIVTSRPEASVTAPLQGLNPYVLDTGTEKNKEDIRQYLIEELKVELKGRPNAEEITEEILTKSEGVFLYVERVCNDIKDGHLSLDHLDKFPKGLGGIFWDFFSRQFPDLDRFKREIRPALRAILAALEPLPLEILQDLFNWQDEELRDFVRTLGSLFPVSELNGVETIRPYHKATIDWLKDESSNSPYYVSLDEGHKQIVELGLTQFREDADSLHSYFLRNLPKHLAKSKKMDELHKLLIDFLWIRKKLEVCGVNPLIKDYDFAPLSDRTSRLIKGALELSSHILFKDIKQLPSQLCGRLCGFEEQELQSFIEQIIKETKTPWLRPLMPTLTAPGGPLIRTLSGHSEKVNSVAISSDGYLAISGSSDKTLKIWDLKTGKEIKTLSGHSDHISCVAISYDQKFALSGSYDNTLKIWDLNSGMEIRTIFGHTGYVKTVAISRDGSFAISGGRDKTLKVWDLKTGNIIRSLLGHESYITSVAISANNLAAVSTSGDKALIIWSLESGEKKRIMTGHSSWVNAVAISANGSFAITGSHDGTLKIWNLKTGKGIRTLRGHSSVVTSVAISSDNSFAVSGAKDGTLKVWDIETGEEIRTFSEHFSWVNSVAISQDGSFAISGADDKTIKKWGIFSQGCSRKPCAPLSRIESVNIFPDCRSVISESTDHILKVWDAETGLEKKSLLGEITKERLIYVFPDGQSAISASWDHKLKVWDLTKNAIIKTLRGHDAWVNSIAISYDGSIAVSGSNDKTVKIWDLETGIEVRTLSGHTEKVVQVAISPNGSLVISGSQDNTLKVWDLEVGEEILAHSGYNSWVRSIAISCDCSFAISGLSDKTLEVWNPKNGGTIRILKGHTRKITSVKISPDGSYVFSGSYDESMKIWNVENGEILYHYSLENLISCSDLDRNGKLIVVGDVSGNVHFLKIENLDINNPDLTS